MLSNEIDLDTFSSEIPTDLYRILSLFDKYMINDQRKMEILTKKLNQKGILTDEPLHIGEYLLKICDTPDEYAGIVYMEANLHPDSTTAKMVCEVFEKYNFTSSANKQFLKKDVVIKKILSDYEIDYDTEFSIIHEYEQFMENKRLYLNPQPIFGDGVVDIPETNCEIDNSDLYDIIIVDYGTADTAELMIAPREVKKNIGIEIDVNEISDNTIPLKIIKNISKINVDKVKMILDKHTDVKIEYVPISNLTSSMNVNRNDNELDNTVGNALKRTMNTIFRGMPVSSINDDDDDYEEDENDDD